MDLNWTHPNMFFFIACMYLSYTWKYMRPCWKLSLYYTFSKRYDHIAIRILLHFLKLEKFGSKMEPETTGKNELGDLLCEEV